MLKDNRVSPITCNSFSNSWLKTVPRDEKDGKMEVREENFFTWAPEEGFQLIYDYTYVLSLKSPPQSADWGSDCVKH